MGARARAWRLARDRGMQELGGHFKSGVLEMGKASKRAQQQGQRLL